jgi:hypothetical protein
MYHSNIQVLVITVFALSDVKANTDNCEREGSGLAGFPLQTMLQAPPLLILLLLILRLAPDPCRPCRGRKSAAGSVLAGLCCSYYSFMQKRKQPTPQSNITTKHETEGITKVSVFAATACDLCHTEL